MTVSAELFFLVFNPTAVADGMGTPATEREVQGAGEAGWPLSHLPGQEQTLVP